MPIDICTAHRHIDIVKKGRGAGTELNQTVSCSVKKERNKCIFLLQQAASVVEACNGM